MKHLEMNLLNGLHNKGCIYVTLLSTDDKQN